MNLKKACDAIVRGVTAQTEENARLRRALINARKELLKCGFCAAGKHGKGDPEINEIDDALTLGT